jgi:hypothetical protein
MKLRKRWVEEGTCGWVIWRRNFLGFKTYMKYGVTTTNYIAHCQFLSETDCQIDGQLVPPVVCTR